MRCPRNIEETVRFSAVVWLNRGLKHVRVEPPQVGKEKKLDTLQSPPDNLDDRLGELCGAELEKALRVQTKKGREVAMKAVKKVAMDTFSVVEEGVRGPRRALSFTNTSIVFRLVATS